MIEFGMFHSQRVDDHDAVIGTGLNMDRAKCIVPDCQCCQRCGLMHRVRVIE